jgi:serine/threonine-protein kinase
VERFYREARAAARLQHRHVMPIWGMGLHEGQHAFVMPVVAGGSLASRLADFQRDRRTAVVLMEKVARGVQALHEQGIVHRDLKPGNVLIDEQGEPLVADFGLAKFVDGSAEMTATGAVVGTPAYMSPEQAAGLGRQVTPASDVCSLGVMLYELTTGRRPFLGASSHEVTQKVLSVDPPLPRTLQRTVPRSLEAVILKCLEKEPKRRYPTAGAVADDLRRWLDGQPVQARPPSVLRLALARSRRSPAVLAVAAGLLVGVIGLAGALLLSGSQPEGGQSGHHELPPAAAKEPTWPVAIEARLGRGEPVELVGATGGPPGHAIRAGNATVMERPQGAGGPFTFATVDFCLLELLPRVPCPRYRFSVQVRHGDSTSKDTDVGLYLLHSRNATPLGIEHCCCTLSFNDQDAWVVLDPAKDIRRSEVALRLWRHRPGAVEHKMDLSPRQLFDPAGPRAVAGWRALAVEVRPDELRVFWEGKQVVSPVPIGPATLRQSFQDWLRLPVPSLANPGLAPRFTPDGGIGLWVRRGRAFFRHVTLTPLKK